MFVVADRVKEYTSLTGLGNVPLEGPESSFISFSSVCSNNDDVYYAVVHRSANEWEIGRGIFFSNAIQRTTLISSSSGVFVDFSAGGKDVFLTFPSTVANIVTRAPGAVILGRSDSGEGTVRQLSITEVKNLLNIQIGDISGVISTQPNNRATINSGVYVPELTLDLVAIYNAAKQ